MNHHKLTNIFLGIIAVTALGFILKLFAFIFVPLVVALLMAFAAGPVLDMATEKGIPRIIPTSIIILLFLGFIYLIGVILYSSIGAFVNQFSTYYARFFEILEDILVRFDLPEDVLLNLEIDKNITTQVLSFTGSFMSFAGSIVILLLFFLFLLLEYNQFGLKMIKAFPQQSVKRISSLLNHINEQIGRYISIKFLISLTTGFLIWLVLSLLNVDFPLIWGILAFLFNFIPSIGSILIVLSISMQAFVQFYPEINPAVLVLLLTTAIQFILGNIIDPKLQGEGLGLSPFLIIFSLLLWGWLWGIMGMILAIPLTVCIRIAFDNIPQLRPFSILMGRGSSKKEK